MKLTLNTLDRVADNAQVYELRADGVHAFEVIRFVALDGQHAWTVAALNFEQRSCDARARVEAVIGSPRRFDGLAAVKRWMRAVERCAGEMNQ